MRSISAPPASAATSIFTTAIDAFLGGPGSTADNFIIDGNVAGTTEVVVADANKGPGVLNKEGISIIFVNGPGVTGDEFFLKKPIDTGFFNYDLFFRPTGSGVFELRSFLGGGAFVLPQLETAMQDMWHLSDDNKATLVSAQASPSRTTCKTYGARCQPV
jgi:outer membrane autotransporter protein